MIVLKFSDEAELDSWYDEQKKLLLEKFEANLAAKVKDPSEIYKKGLTDLMKNYTELREKMILDLLETEKKSIPGRFLK